MACSWSLLLNQYLPARKIKSICPLSGVKNWYQSLPTPSPMGNLQTMLPGSKILPFRDHSTLKSLTGCRHHWFGQHFQTAGGHNGKQTAPKCSLFMAESQQWGTHSNTPEGSTQEGKLSELPLDVHHGQLGGKATFSAFIVFVMNLHSASRETIPYKIK